MQLLYGSGRARGGPVSLAQGLRASSAVFSWLCALASDHAAVASYDLQAKPGPWTRDFTFARLDELRLAVQVYIYFWRSG